MIKINIIIKKNKLGVLVDIYSPASPEATEEEIIVAKRHIEMLRIFNNKDDARIITDNSKPNK